MTNYTLLEYCYTNTVQSQTARRQVATTLFVNPTRVNWGKQIAIQMLALTQSERDGLGSIPGACEFN